MNKNGKYHINHIFSFNIEEELFQYMKLLSDNEIEEVFSSFKYKEIQNTSLS
jgi:hypothetical protein